MSGRISGSGILPIHKGFQTGQRNTDEVHEVVTCECCRESECADEHHYLEDIDLAGMQDLHQDCEEHHAAAEDNECVVSDPMLDIGIHE